MVSLIRLTLFSVLGLDVSDLTLNAPPGSLRMVLPLVCVGDVEEEEVEFFRPGLVSGSAGHGLKYFCRRRHTLVGGV